MGKSFIEIKPLEIEHLQNSDWLNWLSDYETTKFQNLGYLPQNKSRQISYLEKILTSSEDAIFSIEIKRENKINLHIGNVALHKIDFIHRRCVLGIIIGEKEYRGKGVGLHSWDFITNHAFNMLNLRKVYAYIFEGNIPSIKCAESCGYIKEAKFIDYFYRHGKYHNCIVYSKTASK